MHRVDLLLILLSLLLSHLFLPDLNQLIRREIESKKVKMWWRLGDLVLLVKMRLNELRSSKKLAMHHNEAWKGRIINLWSHRLGFQHPCSAVNP